MSQLPLFKLNKPTTIIVEDLITHIATRATEAVVELDDFNESIIVDWITDNLSNEIYLGYVDHSDEIGVTARGCQVVAAMLPDELRAAVVMDLLIVFEGPEEVLSAIKAKAEPLLDVTEKGFTFGHEPRSPFVRELGTDCRR